MTSAPTLYRGGLAQHKGELGRVIEMSGRTLWWKAKDTEKQFFSLRSDGVWRAFPGPANGDGLEPFSMLEMEGALFRPTPTPRVHKCRNNHVLTTETRIDVKHPDGHLTWQCIACRVAKTDRINDKKRRIYHERHPEAKYRSHSS